MSQMTLFDSLSVGVTPPKWVDDPRLVRAHQIGAWMEWVRTSPELVLDYETDGLDPSAGHRPFMVGTFAPDKGAKIVDLRLVPQGLAALREALKDKVSGRVIVHYARNELAMSEALGIEIKCELWDNCAASYALDERRQSHGQKELCTAFGIPTPFADALAVYMMTTFGSKDRGHQHNPNELEVPYNIEDVECAWKLYTRFKREAEQCGMTSLILRDSELTRPLLEMETTGVRFDSERAHALMLEVKSLQAAHYKTLSEAYGRPTDPASHTQLFGILYGEWRLPMHTDVEKQGALDDDVLEWMLTLPEVLSDTRRVHFLSSSREWRECEKMVKTYLMPWLYEHQRNGRLYPHLRETRAGTRRFTCEHPNLQNVPVRTALGKKLRSLIVAELDANTYSYDYSQIEYRTFAHYAGEPSLVEGYRTNRKFDMHAAVAAMLNAAAGLGIKRDDAKHTNFGILYGMGIDKLARKLGVTKERARRILDVYMQAIPTIKALKNRLKEEVRTKGFVSTIFGSRRHLKPNEDFKALNTLCQMTAADIVRDRMVALYKWKRQNLPSLRLQLQVHDELLFHTGTLEPINLEPLRWQLENLPQFRVPMLVEGEQLTPDWGHKTVTAAL